MDQQTNNIVPLLIGGGLALAGTIVSQIFGLMSGWLERRHTRRVVHREKFEELADCLSKTLLWFPKLSDCRTTEQVKACQPPAEARRMVCLTLLYFPQLKDSAADYSNGLTQFYHWAIDCFDPHFPASLGAQMVKAGDSEKRNNAILLLRQKLDNEIEKQAKHYMSA